MVEWKTSTGLVDYQGAVAAMETRVAAIRAGTEPELVWLLEHPPLYTKGTSAKAGGLLDAGRFPVYETGRGGEYTYHGPGQRVGYVMLDLKKRAGVRCQVSGKDSINSVPDLRAFVQGLEQWIIAVLGEFGVEGFAREGRIGVWTVTPESKEAKIAAQGIRVRGGVSYHGVAINVNPDLSHYAGIVPCGIRDFGVTSLSALGKDVSMQALDNVLKNTFPKVFGS